MDKINVDHALIQTHCRWELSNNFVKMVANQHKLPNLNVESLNLLSYDCTYQLFTLLSCAKKIANQNKREHLKGSDIVAALKLCDYDGLYGCGYSQMNYQLQTTTATTANVGGGGRSKGMLTYVDKEFDLESFLSQPPLKLPREVMLHEHWLSINGVVPDIPENVPQITEDNVKALELAESSSNNYHNVNATNNTLNHRNSTNISHGQPMTVFSDKVPLLIERQLVYKELTEACFGQNEVKKKEALMVMSTDLVMKELTPHFACFIRETTKSNVQNPNLGILLNCVRMVKAIFDNTHLKKEFMQNHLHYFVPALLNCIVSRRICVKPESENHWALRCFASKTLANICTIFQNSLPSLSLRVCNIAKRVIECCHTLSTNQQYLVDENNPPTTASNDLHDDSFNTPITEDTVKYEEVELGTISDPPQIQEAQNSTDNPSAAVVDIDSIPFSSYYGASTLLFDMGASVAKLTLLPLLPKLGQLIERTLESDDNVLHRLAKYESSHLKELLIKQTKYIAGSNMLRVYEDMDECCSHYGNYLGPSIFRELASLRNPAPLAQQHTSHCTPSSDRHHEENKHVL